MSEFDKAKMYKNQGKKAIEEGKYTEAKKYYQEAIKQLTILRNRSKPPMKDNYQMMIDTLEKMISKIKQKICEIICKIFGITQCLCNHECQCKKKK